MEHLTYRLREVERVETVRRRRYALFVGEKRIMTYDFVSIAMIDSQKAAHKHQEVRVEDEEGLVALFVKGKNVYYRNVMDWRETAIQGAARD